ncbi:hypothetical protein C8R44DRAFT_531116, partial [Mycena epipterygia]
LLDPPTTSTETLLRSRASPNTRLRAAFHLTNTFVSADPATHSQFFRKSMNLLRVAKSDWKRFARVALQAVDLGLPATTAPFHVFVRGVTLRTIIVGLLDPNADTTSLASGDVDVVTELITDIWLLSKKPGKIPEHLLQRLNDRLRRLVPDEAAYPNPLDFVIPTWETLWRVVAVTMAYVHTDLAACRAFQDLSDNPCLPQFRASRLNGTSPSVEDYITESLRLHPPVKHITRHIFRRRLLTAFLPRFLAAHIPLRVDTEIADIEGAQRSELRGPDSAPDIYDAARFVREPDRVRDVVAFGCGPLKCAAIHWAPMAAAVIVASILNRVDGVGHHIVRGNRVGGREGWDGWMVRK